MPRVSETDPHLEQLLLISHHSSTSLTTMFSSSAANRVHDTPELLDNILQHFDRSIRSRKAGEDARGSARVSLRFLEYVAKIRMQDIGFNRYFLIREILVSRAENPPGPRASVQFWLFVVYHEPNAVDADRHHHLRHPESVISSSSSVATFSSLKSIGIKSFHFGESLLMATR